MEIEVPFALGGLLAASDAPYLLCGITARVVDTQNTKMRSANYNSHKTHRERKSQRNANYGMG
jgi:hypothetical protein